MSTAALITQLSGSTHDPQGRLTPFIGFMFPAIVFLSCPHLDGAMLHKEGPVCHQNQGSPGASTGQRPDVEAVPGRG